MDWTFDLVTNTLTPAEMPQGLLPLKWRSRELMRVQFHRTGTAELLPADSGLIFRLIGSDGTVLAAVETWTTPDDATGWYEGDLILHTAELTTAFDEDTTQRVPAGIELHWWRMGEAATPYISDNLLNAALRRPLVVPETGSPIVLDGAFAWLAARLVAGESITLTADDDEETLTIAIGDIAQSRITGLSAALAAKASVSALSTHIADTANPHAVTKAQIGLGNCDNTSDANKPVSSATQTALNAKADLVTGKVPSSQLPSISLVEFLGAAANQTAMLALRGDAGDFCFRSDQGLAYFITSGNGSQISHWQAVATPGSIGVASVNGHIGVVVLDKSDIDLGNVDNTSDAAKPVSTAQQTALDGKVDAVTVERSPGQAQSIFLSINSLATALASHYVELRNAANAPVRYWFNENASTSPPSPESGVTWVEVAINSSDTTAQIATALAAAIDNSGDGPFSVAVSDSAITCTARSVGLRSAPFSDVAIFNYITVSVTAEGLGPQYGPAVDQDQLLYALQAAITDGKIVLPDGRFLVVMDAAE